MFYLIKGIEKIITVEADKLNGNIKQSEITIVITVNKRKQSNLENIFLEEYYPTTFHFSFSCQIISNIFSATQTVTFLAAFSTTS